MAREFKQMKKKHMQSGDNKSEMYGAATIVQGTLFSSNLLAYT